MLFVSGALDTRVGRAVAAADAARRPADRSTARVSRYKLDEFLQLFDFPSPSQTAEQRFATNVPLQRLFFMNSDFMQQHAERLAEQVADEPDDAARIEKVYRTVFGRAPTAEEIEAGRRVPAGRGVEAVRGAARRGGEGRRRTRTPAARTRLRRPMPRQADATGRRRPTA